MTSCDDKKISKEAESLVDICLDQAEHPETHWLYYCMYYSVTCSIYGDGDRPRGIGTIIGSWCPGSRGRL